MGAIRTETDSLGTIDIPADRYWGPQTERARHLFKVGTEKFPPVLLRALGQVKQAAAEANAELGELPADLAKAIVTAAAEVASGLHDAEFPLPVWQTGSGTQTNMNANEVIANRANELLGHPRGSRTPVHPNDHVNCSQSSNDTFPTVMHVAIVDAVTNTLIPAMEALQEGLQARAEEWADLVKIGRTHMMDAVPVTLGQEFSTWARQIELGVVRLQNTLPRLLQIVQGGTAVGTGLNRNARFDDIFCKHLSVIAEKNFIPSNLKFEGMAAHDTCVELSGVLNVIAVSLTKIGNDIRLLSSGPRCGIGELTVPADGLSSSIMPGKTNPTQVEMLTMVAAQVMGNHVTVTIAGAQGHLELNVFKPVIIQNILQSISLLADACVSFLQNMIKKISPNKQKIGEYLNNSLMLVTALNTHIGYDKAVSIGILAFKDDITLKEAAIRLEYVSEDDFDRWVIPAEMIGPRTT